MRAWLAGEPEAGEHSSASPRRLASRMNMENQHMTAVQASHCGAVGGAGKRNVAVCEARMEQEVT